MIEHPPGGGKTPWLGRHHGRGGVWSTLPKRQVARFLRRRAKRECREEA